MTAQIKLVRGMIIQRTTIGDITPKQSKSVASVNPYVPVIQIVVLWNAVLMDTVVGGELEYAIKKRIIPESIIHVKNVNDSNN